MVSREIVHQKTIKNENPREDGEYEGWVYKSCDVELWFTVAVTSLGWKTTQNMIHKQFLVVCSG